MHTASELQELSDRVLGLAPPLAPLRILRRRRADMVWVLVMFVTSGAAVFGSLALWTMGHGVAGARLFCGSVFMLALMLRLR